MTTGKIREDQAHKPPRPRGSGCEESFPGCNLNAEVQEFLMSLDRYKRRYQRPHPTCTEILDVLRKLGWRKLDAPAWQPTATDDEPDPAV